MREMKDSGTPWIGQIPSTWSLIRFKDKYQSIKEVAREKSVEFEQKLMRWIDTALYKNEESTPQEAEIKLLLYISDFVNAEKE